MPVSIVLLGLVCCAWGSRRNTMGRLDDVTRSGLEAKIRIRLIRRRAHWGKGLLVQTEDH